MKYVIIGSGQIGTALARIFARKNVEVGIANSRGPETLESLAKEAGSYVRPVSIEEAHRAEIIFLAVPFASHKEIAEKFEQWNGKILVDVTNALRVAPQALGGRLSSEIIGEAFVGARPVNPYSPLPEAPHGQIPHSTAQRQAIFVSSNDPEASEMIAALITELGLAPVELGRLNQGGVPLHAVAGRPG